MNGLAIAIIIAIVIVVLSILLKGRKGPLTTHAPDIDLSKNTPNQSKGVRQKMQGWVTQNVWALAFVLGLVLITPLAMWHKTILAFLGGVVPGDIWDWLAVALIVLITAFTIGWFGEYKQVRRAAGFLILVCFAIAGIQLHYDQPLSNDGSLFGSATTSCSGYNPDVVRHCDLQHEQVWASIGPDPNARKGVFHVCLVYLPNTYVDHKPDGKNNFLVRAELLVDKKPVRIWYRAKPGPENGDCPEHDPSLLNW